MSRIRTPTTLLTLNHHRQVDEWRPRKPLRKRLASIWKPFECLGRQTFGRPWQSLQGLGRSWSAFLKLMEGRRASWNTLSGIRFETMGRSLKALGTPWKVPMTSDVCRPCSGNSACHEQRAKGASQSTRHYRQNVDVERYVPTPLADLRPRSRNNVASHRAQEPPCRNELGLGLHPRAGN